MQQSPPGFFGWKWQLAFFIVVFVEVYYMFQYSSTYGVLSLLTLILGSIILGIILMRWEGSICWARILYLNQRGMPTTDEMRDGVLILFAGIMMIIPGLITDVLGLLLFLPPIRWVARKLFLHNLYFEVPSGMESHFRMYSFQNNAQREQQDNSSEQDQSDEFEYDNRSSFDNNQDVQIIDVKATDPKESSKILENENKEEDSTEQESKSKKQNDDA